jgi:hypothetical protein
MPARGTHASQVDKDIAYYLDVPAPYDRSDLSWSLALIVTVLPWAHTSIDQQATSWWT